MDTKNDKTKKPTSVTFCLVCNGEIKPERICICPSRDRNGDLLGSINSPKDENKVEYHDARYQWGKLTVGEIVRREIWR